ncbi:MAG TPA: hypothetical protein VH951_06840 [Dehalococcoidia bacterium]|jgi:hypothetical protein
MEAKIAALEEEINILKGEIKSILQEVRTAILASENPFTGGQGAPRANVSSVPDHQEPKVVQLTSPLAQPVQPEPAFVPAEDAGVAARQPLQAMAPPAAAGPAPERRAEEASLRDAGRGTGADAAGEPARRASQPDVRALAALLTWVEETRERLDERGYKVVLGLARYGDLIDQELETTLLAAAETVGGKETQEHTSVNDSIVALRQLEAILAGDGPSDGRIRRLGDYATTRDESDGHIREVRPSRRQ